MTQNFEHLYTSFFTLRIIVILVHFNFVPINTEVKLSTIADLITIYRSLPNHKYAVICLPNALQSFWTVPKNKYYQKSFKIQVS